MNASIFKRMCAFLLILGLGLGVCAAFAENLGAAGSSGENKDVEKRVFGATPKRSEASREAGRENPKIADKEAKAQVAKAKKESQQMKDASQKRTREAKKKARVVAAQQKRAAEEKARETKDQKEELENARGMAAKARQRASSEAQREKDSFGM